MSRSSCKELKLSSKGLSSLPQALFRRTDLQRLHLDHNDLKTVPVNIAQLTNLVFLNLSHNPLEGLCEELFLLSSLEVLELAHSKLSSIPPSIAAFANVTEINLMGTATLTSLPDEMGSLTALRHLVLDDCKISKLPRSMGGLVELISISMAGNALGKVPSCLARMPSLEFVSLDRNELSSVPVELTYALSLRVLSLRCNQLAEAPPFPPTLCVRLAGNPCTTIDPGRVHAFPHRSMRDWPSATVPLPSDAVVADASFNHVVRLSASICDASGLQELVLRHNAITVLPVAVFNLSAIRHLDVSHNNLASLPKEIALLNSLECLYLSHNHIAQVSNVLSLLESLHTIDLSYNQLAEFPRGCEGISSLRVLRLQSNAIAEVPVDAAQALFALRFIDLSSNQLVELPQIDGPVVWLTGNPIPELRADPVLEPPETSDEGEEPQGAAEDGDGEEEEAGTAEEDGKPKKKKKKREKEKKKKREKKEKSDDDSDGPALFVPPPPEDDDEEAEEKEKKEDEEKARGDGPGTERRSTFMASVSMSVLPISGARSALSAASPLPSRPRTPSFGRPRTPSLSFDEESDTDSAVMTANESDAELEDELGEETDLDYCSQGLTQFPEEVLLRAATEKLQLDMNKLTSIPASISRLDLLQELYLSDNLLTELPDEIGELSMLIVLNVDNNQLEALPRAIGMLKGLCVLKAQKNKLTTLPDTIGSMKNLKELDVSENQLVTLPATMQNMVMLEKLLARDNLLQTIPKKLEKLPRLAVIDTSGNPMGAIVKKAQKAVAERHQDIVSFVECDQSLAEVPIGVYEVEGIELLKLSHNSITELPQRLFGLSSLVEIVLDDNRLAAIPPAIGQLTNLRMLILDKNQITTLPDELFALPLTQLSLNENQIAKVPEAIGELTSLVLLCLDGNLLEDVPDSFGLLTNLQLLSLKQNQITFLPETMGDCESLRALVLDDNQLTDLPIELIGLVNLEMLSVRNNLLCELPAELADIEALASLHVEGNPLEGIVGLVAENLLDVVAERDGLAGLVTELEQKLVANAQEMEALRHTLDEERDQHTKALGVLSSLQADNKRLVRCGKQDLKRLTEAERESRRLIDIIDTAIRSKEVTIKTLQNVLLQLRVTLGEMDKKLSGEFKRQLGNIDKVILDEIKVQDKWIKAATNAKERRRKVGEAMSPRPGDAVRARRMPSAEVSTIFELQKSKGRGSRTPSAASTKRSSELPLKTWGMRKMALDASPAPCVPKQLVNEMPLRMLDLDGGGQRLSCGPFDSVTTWILQFCGDSTLCASFYLCYRKHGSADALFSVFCESFRAIPEGVSSVHQYRLRILHQLQHWVHAHHIHDFHNNATITNAVKNFLQSATVEDNFPQWSKSMLVAMDNLEELSMLKSAEVTEMDSDRIARRKSLKPNQKGIFRKPRKINMASVKAKDLAEQLTLIEFDLFRNIDAVACVDAATRKAHPTVKAQVAWFNKIGLWVASEIVTPTKMKTRAAMIKLFITTMIRCRELRNYNTLLQISAGMHLACVTRLHKTWEMVPRRLIESLEEIKTLMDGHGNYRAYRDELAAVRPPMIPYFGVCTRDLTFMDDGNTDEIDGMINFDKMRLMGKVVQDFQRMQDVSYSNIMPLEDLQDYLQNIGDFKDSELHKISVANEAREDF